MKALTLTQPWATLVALGEKRIETRSWSTSYRGRLAIHAAKGLGPVGGKDGLRRLVNQEPFKSALRSFPGFWGETGGVSRPVLPLGAVVAVVNLRGCVSGDLAPAAQTLIDDGRDAVAQRFAEAPREEEFGFYGPGRFAWLLDDIRPIAPVDESGELGLWDLRPAALRDVQAQIYSQGVSV